VVYVPTLQSRQDSDLCICEFEPDHLPLRLTTENVRRTLFIVDRKDLEAFRARLGDLRANVLLKPVVEPALRPFLEHAMDRYQSGNQDAGNSAKPSEELLDCLLRAHLRLQEHDQDRTNFLARALHDFRAPLTALGGYCSVLIEGRLGALNSEQREVLRRMQHSVKRISVMSSGLFDLSVGRYVNREPNFERSDIEACVSQAVHELTPLMEAKSIQLSVEVESPGEPLRFDSSKIEQVLINLLDNACKFSSKNGTVEVSGYPVFWPDGPQDGSSALNAYRIQVSDSGLGIPPERVELIFEEYTSYAGGQDRSSGGLGLAICRMIVSAHGGRIWAESDRGKTRFIFVLPFNTMARQPRGFAASREHSDVARA
jgi:signal transduction histidine kinase